MTTRGGHSATFELHLEPAADSVPVARQALVEWLGQHHVGTGPADELAVVATELCTNAVRAARTSVVLRARLEPGYVVLEASDDGEGFAGELPPAKGLPRPMADAGRGLYVVRRLVDTLWMSSGSEGTTIRCARRLDR